MRDPPAQVNVRGASQRMSRSKQALLLLMLGCGAVITLGMSATASAARVILDIPYESPGGKDSFLDVYLPDEGVPSEAATVLFIHGGGWTAGDKANQDVFHTTTADAGYPVVACNYTLATEDAPSFPQVIYDVKAVVRWIREAGGEYDLPPTIVAVGTSAGAHLAMMLGTTAGVEGFEPLAPPPGGYAIDGVVSFFGLSDLVFQARIENDAEAVELLLGVTSRSVAREMLEDASPINHVSTDDAPTALYHGRQDNVVPYEHSVRMDAALSAAGVFSKLSLVSNAGHTLDDFGGQTGASRKVTDLIPTLLAGEEPAAPPAPSGPSASTDGNASPCGAGLCGAGLLTFLPLTLLALCGLKLRARQIERTPRISRRRV